MASFRTQADVGATQVAVERPRRSVVGRALGMLALGACAALMFAGQANAAAPVTTATPSAAPNGDNGWYKSGIGQVNVKLEATGTGTGVGAIRYRLSESDDWTTATTNPVTVYLGDGVNIISYSSVDDDGVEEAVKQVELKVDTVNPTPTRDYTPFLASAYGGAWLPGLVARTAAVDPPSIAIAYKPAPEDEVSGIASVEHRLGSTGAWVSGDTPFTFNQPGTFEIEARTTDLAGNSSQQTFPVVVERVTDSLKMTSKAKGKKTVKANKTVTLRVSSKNNYTAPMNLETTICAKVSSKSLVKVKGKACQVHFSLPAGETFTPKFKLKPTSKAKKRVKKGKKVKVKVNFTIDAPGVGTKTQRFNLRVKK